MAIKGASDDKGAREVFTKPSVSIDIMGRGTKASRYGVRPHMVGTQKAKDLIAARLKLKDEGAGRFHFYQTVRQDYYEQVTSEVKVPHRTVRGRKVWQKKSGVRNEVLDCEVYALHASRRLRVHIIKPGQWDDLERQIMQSDLFDDITAEKSKKPAKKKRRATTKRQSTGYVGRYKR